MEFANVLKLTEEQLTVQNARMGKIDSKFRRQFEANYFNIFYAATKYF